jgi:hypothetical protein
MFPLLTTTSGFRRSLAERLREAAATALEFATLGEATLGPSAHVVPAFRPAARAGGPTAPTAAHPHRRRIVRQSRERRPGMARARTQHCRAPVHRPVLRRQS